MDYITKLPDGTFVFTRHETPDGWAALAVPIQNEDELKKQLLTNRGYLPAVAEKIMRELARCGRSDV